MQDGHIPLYVFGLNSKIYFPLFFESVFYKRTMRSFAQMNKLQVLSSNSLPELLYILWIIIIILLTIFYLSFSSQPFSTV